MNIKHHDNFEQKIDELLGIFGKTKEDLPEYTQELIKPENVAKVKLLDEFNELCSYNAVISQMGVFLQQIRFYEIDVSSLYEKLKEERKLVTKKIHEIQDQLMGIKLHNEAVGDAKPEV